MWDVFGGGMVLDVFGELDVRGREGLGLSGVLDVGESSRRSGSGGFGAFGVHWVRDWVWRAPQLACTGASCCKAVRFVRARAKGLGQNCQLAAGSEPERE
jgi:hypothetical protein